MSYIPYKKIILIQVVMVATVFWGVPTISFATYANQPNTIGVAQALSVIMAVAPNVGGALGDVLLSLGSYEDVASLNDGLSTIAILNDGAVQTSFGVPSNAYRIIDSHLNERSSCQAIWLKAFGEKGHQQNQDGVQGYNNTVWGFVLGSDARVRENLVLGAAFSWSELQVRNALAEDTTRANSYQEAFYGEYDFVGTPWYIDGMLSLTFYDYFTSHNILMNDLNLSARGHYYAWQPGIQAELGYDYVTHAIHVIPLAFLYYTFLKLTSYTENGAGNASQQVSGHTYEMLLGGLGLQLIYDDSWKKWIYEKEVHFKFFYDFINDRMQTTAQFLGAGPSFSTQGIQPPAASFDVGLSFNVYSQAGLSCAFSYDYAFEKNYSEHAGLVRVRVEW